MLFGIGLKVASTLVFSGMAAFVKLSSASYPVSEIIFFRSILALGVLVGWLWLRGDFPRALRTQWISGHLLRGTVGASSMVMGFTVFGVLPLADATAIGYATSLIIVVFAALVLGEHVRAARWLAVIAGFGGVLVTLWQNLGGTPRLASVDLGLSPAALIGGTCTLWVLFTAGAMLQTRRLAQSEETGAIVFWFQMTTTSAGVILMLVAAIWPSSFPLADLVQAQRWITPDLQGAMILCSLGILGGLGQIWMTQAFRYCDASVLACFDYASLVWAVLLGILLFGQVPSALSFLGVTIIAVAGLFLVWRERRSARLAASIAA